MAVSRRLALLSLGTILLCSLLARSTVANSDYGDDFHTVQHSPGVACKGEHPDKGEQCSEENDATDQDDDFDDTYKIVNNIAIRLSASGNLPEDDDEESEDVRASEEEVGSMFVLGH